MSMFENLAKQLEELDDGEGEGEDEEPMDEATVKQAEEMMKGMWS
jgi:hypothetical protein